MEDSTASHIVGEKGEKMDKKRLMAAESAMTEFLSTSDIVAGRKELWQARHILAECGASATVGELFPDCGLSPWWDNLNFSSIRGMNSPTDVHLWDDYCPTVPNVLKWALPILLGSQYACQ